MTSGVVGNDVMHNKHIGLLVHFASPSPPDAEFCSICVHRCGSSDQQSKRPVSHCCLSVY